MFADDRTYLENKYHDTSKPFNPFERMAYHAMPLTKPLGLTMKASRKA